MGKAPKPLKIVIHSGLWTTPCQWIQELIDKENLDPDRGNNPNNVLAPIKIDPSTNKILSEKK